MSEFNTEEKVVPIDNVFPNKWNPNQQNEKIFKKLKKNIKEVGFVVPVLVREIGDEVYEIIDGEHKWRAAQELGYEEIKISNMGEVSDNLAKVLTINMNNIKGEDDLIKRAEILKSLEDGQLSLLPFDKDEIREELELLDFDFDKYETDQISQEEHTENIFQKAMKKATSLDRVLRELHKESSNEQLRLILEGYFDWYRKFSQIEKNE